MPFCSYVLKNATLFPHALSVSLGLFICLVTPLEVCGKEIQETRTEKLQKFSVTKPFFYTLDNGLKLVVDVDNRAPVVSHTIWYKVGAADEKDGESGIAHFLEHLMFRGTNNFEAGYFSKRISELGGNDNAFTTHDLTAYYQNIPTQHLEEIMEMEANRMRHIQITEEELIKERNVVLEERALRTDTNPTAQLFEQMNASLFRNHPYRAPVIGWKHEIEALNKKQVMAFYHQYYAPNNAVVTIVGDVDPSHVFEIAQATYGKIKPSKHININRQRPSEPPQIATREITLTHPNVTVDNLFLMLEALSPTHSPKEFHALSAAINHIAGGAHSILYKKLVKQQKIALSVGAFIASDKLDNASLIFQMTPANHVSLNVLKAAFKKELMDIINKGIDKQDIEREKNAMLANYITSFDSRTNRAHLWGKNLAFNKTLSDIIQTPKIIASITPDDANIVLQSVFTPQNQVWGYLKRIKP
ncbi:MAG: zinc protease [Alphaproteobacteria bacterium]|jgi:zinc protease